MLTLLSLLLETVDVALCKINVTVFRTPCQRKNCLPIFWWWVTWFESGKAIFMGDRQCVYLQGNQEWVAGLRVLNKIQSLVRCFSYLWLLTYSPDSFAFLMICGYSNFLSIVGSTIMEFNYTFDPNPIRRSSSWPCHAQQISFSVVKF